MKTYTNDRPLRTTTRARATAEAIRDAVPFVTSGALDGITVDQPGYMYEGYLRGDDAAALSADLADRRIVYVVHSYSTPIAWKCDDGSWYKVMQTFSNTTSKHQSNLYLIPGADHEVSINPTGERGEYTVACSTCDSVNVTHSTLVGIGTARAAAHTHRINGRRQG